MAMSDLRSIMHNAKSVHDMLKPNTNLPEWCQSKITLAEDYVSTVANYMQATMSEENVAEAKKMKGPDPCWDDYKMIGTKMKNGKQVPNCVPEQVQLEEIKRGLYANIHAKRKRIAKGSGERMRKPGTKGAPTAQAFRDSAKTAKK